jgi:predicted MFS family arabinose efflux permease
MSALHQEQLNGAEVAPPDRPSLWRNHDFLILWAGQVVSSVGTQMSLLTFPLLILAVTHSPAQAGLIGALRSLPYVVLLLPAGALVDRWDRKRTMIVCDAGRFIALGSIPVALAFGQLSIILLAVASLVEGTLFTFFNVAETACLPRVVPREQLPAAVSLSSATDSVSMMVGPSIGGALYGLSRGLPFLTDAISYGASVISLFFIKTEFQQERTQAPDTLWREIREGLSWLFHHPVLRFIALLTGGLNLFSFGYTLILIVFAQHLHASPFAIGVMFATGGVGSVLGSLAVSPLQRRFSFGQIMIGSTWFWALSWPLYDFAPNIWILGLVNAFGFIVLPVYMGTQYSYRLTLIPDELQGRVNSVFKLVAFGVQPVSLALTGALLQWFGPVTTIWLIFVPQVVLATCATLNRPLRHAPSQAQVAQDLAS